MEDKRLRIDICSLCDMLSHKEINKSSGQHLIGNKHKGHNITRTLGAGDSRVSHSPLFNCHIYDFVHTFIHGTLLVEEVNWFCSEKTSVHVKERLIPETIVGTRMGP